jgi:hypothetical protein
MGKNCFGGSLFTKFSISTAVFVVLAWMLPLWSQAQEPATTPSAPAEKTSGTPAAAKDASSQATAPQTPSATKTESPNSASAIAAAAETANQSVAPSKQQPKRILGLMPNFRAVSAGAMPPPPTPKQAFVIATRNSFDYSSFVFRHHIAAGRDE